MKETIRLISILFCFGGGLLNPAFAQVNLSKGLLAFYPFNGNANDVSGSGFDATINNASTAKDRFGFSNRAYYCDGKSIGMTVSSFSNAGAKGVTLSLWINTTATGSSIQLVQGAPGVIYMNYWKTGHYFAAFDGTGNNNSSSDESSGTINSGKWVNVTTTNNGTTTKTYINGVLDKSYSETLKTYSTYFYMAAFNSGSGNGFNGYFDDVRVYTRALSDSEIMALYEMPEAFFSCNSNFCLGDSLKCKDSSFSNGKLTYAWDFGDNLTSTAKNPGHLYTKAGTFKINLTITTPFGATDTFSRYITVNDKPKPSFTVNDSVQCFKGNSFSFFNTSSCANPMTFKWDLGDGSTSTSTTLSHSFAAAGLFKVLLRATSTYGCTDTSSRYMVVSKVNPGFTVNTAKQCLSGNSFNFTNTSTGTGIVAYHWDFGDGNSSSSASPAYSYANPGTYKVQLNDLAGTGCTDTISRIVVVYASPVAIFTINNRTQCFNNQSFQFSGSGNITSGKIVSWDWDFGDNNSASTQNTTHVYKSSGTFPVKLNIISDIGCSGIAYDTVKINPATLASFTINASKQCLSSNIVKLTNTSSGSGNLSYLWDFGDGNKSDSANPVFSYSSPGTYNIQLIAISENGCEDTASQSITIYPSPVATFSVNNKSQCSNSENFKFGGYGVIGSGAISSWQWDFGDKNTSVLQNPSHIYSSSGVFHVTLTVSSDKGCAGVANDSVVVNLPPNAGYTVNKTEQCILNQNFLFTNTSSASTGTLSYQWNFGDGSTYLNNTNPSYKYKYAGTYSVLLTTYSDQGCADTISKTVTVLPIPFASINASGSTKVCQGDYVSLFTNIASGYSYQWLRDGQKITSDGTSGIYKAFTAGNYKVVVSNPGGCSDTSASIIIIISQPPSQPVITQQGHLLLSGGGVSYKWFLNGVEIKGTNLPYYQPVVKKGNFTVMITDSNGCSSTSDVFVYDITGIPDPISINPVRIFPNPVHNILNVDFGLMLPDVRYLQILDINGKCIKNIEITSKDRNLEIPVTGYPKGIYFIRIRGNNENRVEKVIFE